MTLATTNLKLYVGSVFVQFPSFKIPVYVIVLVSTYTE